MLRRLLAAALALSIAVPLPALAGALTDRCTMDGPMLVAERCDCCTAPAAGAPSHCGGTAATAASGCACAIRADVGSEPRTAAAPAAPNVTFDVQATLLPADVSTPARPQRTIALAASPPGAGAAVSRPAICSWII